MQTDPLSAESSSEALIPPASSIVEKEPSSGIEEPTKSAEGSEATKRSSQRKEVQTDPQSAESSSEAPIPPASSIVEKEPSSGIEEPHETPNPAPHSGGTPGPGSDLESAQVDHEVNFRIRTRSILPPADFGDISSVPSSEDAVRGCNVVLPPKPFGLDRPVQFSYEEDKRTYDATMLIYRETETHVSGRILFRVPINDLPPVEFVECMYEGDTVRDNDGFYPDGIGSVALGPERREVYRGVWADGKPVDNGGIGMTGVRQASFAKMAATWYHHRGTLLRGWFTPTSDDNEARDPWMLEIWRNADGSSPMVIPYFNPKLVGHSDHDHFPISAGRWVAVHAKRMRWFGPLRNRPKCVRDFCPGGDTPFCYHTGWVSAEMVYPLYETVNIESKLNWKKGYSFAGDDGHPFKHVWASYGVFDQFFFPLVKDGRNYSDWISRRYLRPENCTAVLFQPPLYAGSPVEEHQAKARPWRRCVAFFSAGTDDPFRDTIQGFPVVINDDWWARDNFRDHWELALQCPNKPVLIAPFNERIPVVSTRHAQLFHLQFFVNLVLREDPLPNFGEFDCCIGMDGYWLQLHTLDFLDQEGPKDGIVDDKSARPEVSWGEGPRVFQTCVEVKSYLPGFLSHGGCIPFLFLQDAERQKRPQIIRYAPSDAKKGIKAKELITNAGLVIFQPDSGQATWLVKFIRARPTWKEHRIVHRAEAEHQTCWVAVSTHWMMRHFDRDVILMALAANWEPERIRVDYTDEEDPDGDRCKLLKPIFKRSRKSRMETWKEYDDDWEEAWKTRPWNHGTPMDVGLIGASAGDVDAGCARKVLSHILETVFGDVGCGPQLPVWDDQWVAWNELGPKIQGIGKNSPFVVKPLSLGRARDLLMTAAGRHILKSAGFKAFIVRPIATGTAWSRHVVAVYPLVNGDWNCFEPSKGKVTTLLDEVTGATSIEGAFAIEVRGKRVPRYLADQRQRAVVPKCLPSDDEIQRHHSIACIRRVKNWMFEGCGKEQNLSLDDRSVCPLLHLGVPSESVLPALLPFFASGEEPFAAVFGLAPNDTKGLSDFLGVRRLTPGGSASFYCPRKGEGRSLRSVVKGRAIVSVYRVLSFP